MEYICIYNLHSFLNHSLWFSKTQKPSIFDAKVTPEDLHLLLLLLDGPFRYFIRAFRPLPGPGSPAMEQTKTGKNHSLQRDIMFVHLGLTSFFPSFFHFWDVDIDSSRKDLVPEMLQFFPSETTQFFRRWYGHPALPADAGKSCRK